MSLGQSSPPASSLPPQTQVRVLLIILGVAAITLVTLILLTVIRRILRRPGIGQTHRPSRRPASPPLSPWEQAGRRAAPDDETPANGGKDQGADR